MHGNRPPPLNIKSFLKNIKIENHRHDNDTTTQTLKTGTKSFDKSSLIIEQSQNSIHQSFVSSQKQKNQKQVSQSIHMMNSSKKLQNVQKSKPDNIFGFNICKVQFNQQNKSLEQSKQKSSNIIQNITQSTYLQQQKPALKKQNITFKKSSLEESIELFSKQAQVQQNSLLNKKQTIKNPQSVTSFGLSDKINVQTDKRIMIFNDSNKEKLSNLQKKSQLKRSKFMNELGLQSIIKQNQTTQKKQIKKSQKTPQQLMKKVIDHSQQANKQSTSVSHINFTTQKKKPLQSKNNSSTITHSRKTKTQQHIFSPLKKDSTNKVLENDDANNILLQIFGGIQTPPQKISKNQKDQGPDEKKSSLYQKRQNKFLKAVAQLETGNQISRLKTTMMNQKNLKLKDYLRLASLSNDSKFDNYNQKNTPRKNTLSTDKLALKQNQNGITHLKKSFIFNKSKTAIDSEKSIALIKASLFKKLQKIIVSTLKVFEQLQQNKQLIGNQYEDLVFMCNIHKIFDQNLFKSTSLLQELWEQYKQKRNFCEILKKQVTEETIIQMMSPRKKNKKTEQWNLSLIQKILLGLNIIKNEVLQQTN